MKPITKAVGEAAVRMSDLVTLFEEAPLGSVMVLTGIIVSPEGEMVDKAILVEVAGSDVPFEGQTRSTHYVSDTQIEGMRTVGMGARWPVGAQAETVAAGPLPKLKPRKVRKVSGFNGARL